MPAPHAALAVTAKRGRIKNSEPTSAARPSSVSKMTRSVGPISPFSIEYFANSVPAMASAMPQAMPRRGPEQLFPIESRALGGTIAGGGGAGFDGCGGVGIAAGAGGTACATSESIVSAGALADWAVTEPSLIGGISARCRIGETRGSCGLECRVGRVRVVSTASGAIDAATGGSTASGSVVEAAAEGGVRCTLGDCSTTAAGAIGCAWLGSGAALTTSLNVTQPSLKLTVRFEQLEHLRAQPLHFFRRAFRLVRRQLFSRFEPLGQRRQRLFLLDAALKQPDRDPKRRDEAIPW